MGELRETAGCIVCGVESPSGASEPLLVARWLSRRLGWRLVLVHAARIPVAFAGRRGAPDAFLFDDLLEAALAQARTLLEQTSEQHGLDEAECRVVLGDPVEGLSAIAEEEGAGLVVVGSHRRSALIGALRGSVSRSLAARGHCPVVAVPAGSAIPRFLIEPAGGRGPETAEARTRRSAIALPRGGARGGRNVRAGAR